MKPVLTIFMILAGCGFVLTVIVHGVAINGTVLKPNPFPILFPGVFMVWFVAVLVSIKTSQYSYRKDFWKTVLAGCPAWMRYGIYIIVAYAIINFLLFITTAGNQPKSGAGEMSATEIRGFSGHLMVFYAVAFCIIYSKLKAPERYFARKCPQNHVVSPTAHFCPECGYEFK